MFFPLLSNSWYSMHDTTSVIRAYLLAQTVSSGQIPPIWSSAINYPLFHFYAPLFTYISAILGTILNSYFWGVKVTLVITCVLGCVGMYKLMRHHGRAAALLSTFAFALLPYAAVNLFVRGAFAEYLAMNLLPWLFWAWTDLSTIRKQITAAVITTAFILSHNLIPFITIPFLLIYLLVNRSFITVLRPLIISLALSAFFILPLIFERHFVVADSVAVTTDYSLHFVAPTQLWNSLWGFGGSAPGLNDGMSFKLGKVQLILALIGALAYFWRGRWYFPLTFIFASFMTTEYSRFLWQHIPYLPIVQFPWRYLTVAGFFLSILAGYSATTVPKKFRYGYLLLAVIILIVINLKLFRPQQTFPADLSTFTSPSYLQTIPHIIPEYSPVWLHQTNPPTHSDSTVIPVPYYPTWRVILDNHKVTSYPSVDGKLAFANPTNSSNYLFYQSHTTLETVANIISLIAVILVIYYWQKSHEVR